MSVLLEGSYRLKLSLCLRFSFQCMCRETVNYYKFVWLRMKQAVRVSVYLGFFLEYAFSLKIYIWNVIGNNRIDYKDKTSYIICSNLFKRNRMKWFLSLTLKVIWDAWKNWIWHVVLKAQSYYHKSNACCEGLPKKDNFWVN